MNHRDRRVNAIPDRLHRRRDELAVHFALRRVRANRGKFGYVGAGTERLGSRTADDDAAQFGRPRRARASAHRARSTMPRDSAFDFIG